MKETKFFRLAKVLWSAPPILLQAYISV